MKRSASFTNDFNRAESDRATNTTRRSGRTRPTSMRQCGMARKRGKGSRTPPIYKSGAAPRVSKAGPQLIDAICSADLDFGPGSGFEWNHDLTQLHQVRALMQRPVEIFGWDGQVPELWSRLVNRCSHGIMGRSWAVESGLEWDGPSPRAGSSVAARERRPEMFHVEHPMLPGVTIPALQARTLSYARRFCPKPETVVSSFSTHAI